MLFKVCRKGYESCNDVYNTTQCKVNYRKGGERRAQFKACRKGYETSTDLTQLKVKGL